MKPKATEFLIQPILLKNLQIYKVTHDFTYKVLKFKINSMKSNPKKRQFLIFEKKQ